MRVYKNNAVSDMCEKAQKAIDAITQLYSKESLETGCKLSTEQLRDIANEAVDDLQKIINTLKY